MILPPQPVALIVNSSADLIAALARSDVIAGSTITLAEGVYTGDFTSYLHGEAGNPIVFKAAIGARVTINGKLSVQGAYTTWRGIEITYLDWTTRVFDDPGSADPVQKMMRIDGLGTRIEHCVIHDLPVVFATEGEFYGCIIYHNGWKAPDRGHGYGIYAQGASPRLFKHNIIFTCFGYALCIYAEGSKRVDNFTLIENTCFRGGRLMASNALRSSILLGATGQIAGNPVLQRNNTGFGASEQLGYVAGAVNAVLQDNYFPEGLTKVGVQVDSETGNFYGPEPANGKSITVWADDYVNGRGIITVYNWDRDDNVIVDVSAALPAGTAYRLYNVQDYYSDVATGNVAGDGTISIDMRAASHSVAAPVQWNAVPMTFPYFGCFVLEAA